MFVAPATVSFTSFGLVFSNVFGLVCMDMLKLSMPCGRVSCCVNSDGGASRHSEKRSMSVAQIDTVLVFFLHLQFEIF